MGSIVLASTHNNDEGGTGDNASLVGLLSGGTHPTGGLVCSVVISPTTELDYLAVAFSGTVCASSRCSLVWFAKNTFVLGTVHVFV
jgi:hypothetical protein